MAVLKTIAIARKGTRVVINLSDYDKKNDVLWSERNKEKPDILKDPTPEIEKTKTEVVVPVEVDEPTAETDETLEPKKVLKKKLVKI